MGGSGGGWVQREREPLAGHSLEVKPSGRALRGKEVTGGEGWRWVIEGLHESKMRNKSIEGEYYKQETWFKLFRNKKKKLYKREKS